MITEGYLELCRFYVHVFKFELSVSIIQGIINFLHFVIIRLNFFCSLSAKETAEVEDIFINETIDY